LELRVANVAESNFLVARKNDGEKPGFYSSEKSHEPENLRGEYIPIHGKVKTFLAEFWIKIQKFGGGRNASTTP